MSEQSEEVPAEKVQVTELEMTSAPKVFLPVPVNLQTALIRAVKIPLPYYRYLYSQVGHRWMWVDRLRMPHEQLEAILHDERTNVTVLYVQGAPAGFFELFRVDDEVVELSYFGLMNHALGMGIGKWFLLQALYAAWMSNPLRVKVSTNSKDHPRALQLYQRFGFSPTGTHEAEVRPLDDEEILRFARRDLSVTDR